MTAEGSIDKLSIEVSSTAASAVRDIKDLSDALTGLKGSIGKSAAKLEGIASSVSSLKRASAGLQLGGLKQLEGLKVSSTIGKNIKTVAAAVSLMPADTQARIAPLAALKALDGVKMSSSVGGNVAKIATALTFMPTDTASRLAGISTLKHLNGVKISSSVPNNLTKLAQAVNSFPADSGTRLAGLARTLIPLKQLNGMRITTALNGLRELPEVLRKYETLNIKNLISQLDLLNPRLKSLAESASALKLAFNKMPSSLRTVASATKTVVSANRQLETSQNAVARGTTSLIAKFGSLNMAFHYLWNGLAKCVNEVNTYIENMNLFQASMGGYTKAATEFGNTVQDAMGIDFGQWARNQGVFQTLITGMGDTADRAAVMSQQLTQLGYDISSFYNISVEDAMLKLQSGMAGELEPLRRLGWDLSNARMQLEATKLGIDGNVASMTQAEKVGLRYYLIMNQVTQVHGDMARTIASPANQLRVLQAQVTLAARAIGSLLIPMLNAILPYAIAAAKAIRLLAQTIASFFGIDATFEVDYSNLDLSGIASGTGAIEDTADALDDAGSAADDAAKKMQEYKNTVMGFDELNKLNDVPEDTDTGAGGGGGAGIGDLGGAGLDLPLDTYDFLDGLNDYITKLSDDIANKMVEAVKKIAPVVAGVGAGFAAWKIGKGLLSNAAKLATLLGTCSSKAVSLANGLLRAGTTSVGGKVDNLLGSIARSLGSASTFMLGLSANAAKLAPVIAGIAVVAALVVTHFANLYVNSENFRRGLDVILGVLSQIVDFALKLPEVFALIPEFFRELGGAIYNLLKSIGIDLSFLEPIANAFLGLLGVIGDIGSMVNEVFDLQWTDAMMVAGAGIALLAGHPGIALLLVALEAISLGIRAIGYATAPCVESVDALANVSQETADKFGTSLQSMEDATRELDKLDFANSVISDEDVANIESKVLDIHDTIVDNLDGERNQELAELHSLVGVFTEEEIAATEARINGYYDDQINIANEGSAEINRIMKAAADENRALTEEESARINEIKESMYQQLVATSGATRDELDAIEKAMAQNSETAALQAAEAAIQAAKQRKEETEHQADEEYENTITWAKQMYDANEISEERYKELVDMAEEAHTNAYNAAKEGYDKTIEETKTTLDDLSNKIDYSTGKIKSNWDVFWQDVSTTAGTWLGDIKDKYQKWERDVSQAWDNFTADIASAWNNLCNDIDRWYRQNLEPTINDIQTAFEIAGEAIGRFFSDPVGVIQDAWGYLSDWFYSNVIRPIEDMFRGIDFSLPDLKLPHIVVGGYIDVPVLGVIPDPSQLWVEWYANGGFPTSGQLFMARENGIPELVGSMNGKNAVANNQQIIQGIEQGVMSAMIQVLPAFQSEQGQGDVTLVVNIDGQELARGVARGSAQAARRGQLKPEFQFV